MRILCRTSRDKDMHKKGGVKIPKLRVKRIPSLGNIRVPSLGKEIPAQRRATRGAIRAASALGIRG